jgi:hypothetical protein
MFHGFVLLFLPLLPIYCLGRYHLPLLPLIKEISISTLIAFASALSSSAFWLLIDWVDILTLPYFLWRIISILSFFPTSRCLGVALSFGTVTMTRLLFVFASERWISDYGYRLNGPHIGRQFTVVTVFLICSTSVTIHLNSP